MSKIYCCVYNGLGNQLFAYALGLHISKKYNKELSIDLTKLNMINFLSILKLKKDTRREYELHKLGFIDPVYRFNYPEIVRKFKFYKSKQYLFADYRQLHSDLGFVDSNIHIYTLGWGNFNLVKDILPDLRARLSPNFEITPQIEQAKKIIQIKNSVALHIRRTDYLNPGIGNRFDGVCTDTYYENAIQYIKEHVKDPYFIIFSDDINYVKENLRLEDSYIVSGNAGYADLYLMSLCKHFIVANSTFSFWGAILSKLHNKIVCTPAYWYRNPLETEAYIPEEWMKIAIV